MQMFRQFAPLMAGVALALLVALLPPQSLAQQGTIHTIQPGETLASIAEQYGITPRALAEANGITVSTQVVNGDPLLVPVGAGPSAAPTRSSAASQGRQLATLVPFMTSTPRPSPTPTLTPVVILNAEIVRPVGDFTLNTSNLSFPTRVSIRANVLFDPALHAYWAVEIRAASPQAILLPDDGTPVPGGANWLTLSRGTAPVDNAVVAEVRGAPVLSEGDWTVRLVLVNLDGSLDAVDTLSFTVVVGQAPQQPTQGVDTTAPIVVPGQLTASVGQNASLTGSVRLGPGDAFFKVDIRDPFAPGDFAAGQGNRFTDWTTVGSTRTTSVEAGSLATLAAGAGIPPGNYLLRVVIVNQSGGFSAERLVRFTVQ